MAGEKPDAADHQSAIVIVVKGYQDDGDQQQAKDNESA
jgi:hypothetical protein